MINIDTKELIEVLQKTPAAQNIMLVGRHGIGKSEILTDFFSSQKMKVVALFLGQMSDPGDLIGLPYKDEKTGHTSFMPPYWFPTDNTPVVLFLDELNRARPEVLQTIMDLALNRRLAGRALPEGSRVISAVNDGEEYQLTDLDPALVSRFNVYAFRPTVQDWLLWADRIGIDERVSGFISENSEWLDGVSTAKTGIDSGLEKSPDRRAWKKVSDVVKGLSDISPLDVKLIAGIVGIEAASKFRAYASSNSIVTGKQVCLEFDKVKDKIGKYRLHELCMVNDGVFRFLETKLTKKEQDKAGKNVLAYVSFLESSEHKEVLANFASSFSGGLYPNALGILMDKVPDIYNVLVNYINNISQ